MKTNIMLAVALILLTSCSFSTYPKYITNSYPDTNPNEIMIYPKSIDQEYEIIGVIGTEVKGDSIMAIERIKKKASKHGADAIIHFSLNQINSSELTGGSGLAVKLVEVADVKYSLR
ncbi:MAG: hypothetical protein P8Y99_12785 [Calditrichaceae bacterium]